MTKSRHIPVTLLIYFSVATMVAEAGVLGTLWMKGRLGRERLLQLVAVAYDVDLFSIWSEMLAASQPIARSHVSYEEVLVARRTAGKDLDLREVAVDKGLEDIRQLQVTLGKDRQRYDTLRTEFERRLEQLRQGAADQAVVEVQRQLEALSPALAKDQLVRILDDPALDSPAALQFVVTIIKAMPLDKRKKIMAEFKNQDLERLHGILRQIRLGVPDVQLIRETREQLQQLTSQN